MKAPLLPETFTSREIATIFKVTERTVRNWIKEGILPSVRIGHVVRVPAEAVFALLKSQPRT